MLHIIQKKNITFLIHFLSMEFKRDVQAKAACIIRTVMVVVVPGLQIVLVHCMKYLNCCVYIFIYLHCALITSSKEL